MKRIWLLLTLCLPLAARGLRGLTTIGAVALAACTLPPLLASATLVLSPDGITVYDTVNNISWLADANLAATNRFGLPVCNGSSTQTCVNPSGSMSYQTAAAWVKAMNAANYLGHTNWQLPATPAADSHCSATGPQNNSFAFNCTANALGSLYYNALGLKAPNTAVPILNSSAGPFSNFQPYLYWSQTITTTTGTGYGTFSFNTGFQGSNSKPNFLYILPMIQGKLSGTPPASGNGLEINPGGQTVYDPVANVTWLANANLAATNTFGLPPCTDPGSPKICVNQDGAMNWDSASQFVTNMNTYNSAGYLGQTNWQLPPMDPSCGVSYNCVSPGNPFAELFYDQLGLSEGTPVAATPDIAVGPFRHIQPYLYWACQGATIQDPCQTDGPATGFEWSFSFGNGFLGTDVLKNEFYVTANFPGPPTSAAGPVTTFPHVADGNGFDTLVLLINTGTTDATYSLQFFNQGGAQVTYQLDPAQSGMTGVIHGGSQAIVRTAGSGNFTNLGWGQLTASASVKGMLIYQQQAPASLQEGSAPITAPSQHFFFPFDNTGGSTTSIGFVNPSPALAAAVNFTVRYASGGTDMVPALTVNPLQQMAQPVTGIWAATAGQRGMIEVNANTPIGLVAFRFQGSAFTLFDTIAATAGGSAPITSTVAHAADGNNFRSTFLLTNSGTAAAPYTLNIYGPAGQPQTFGFDVASPLSGTVPAGTTLTIDTTGLGSVTNLGWAQLSAAPAVSGIEVFRQTNPGRSEQQATIPISQTNLSHFFLPFDNAANTTSIALANPDPAIAATINATFRYADGTSNTGQFTLPPRNYNANLLASLFSDTAGKAGVAEFSSNVPVAVVEVRFNPTQAFTSLRAVNP